ncbi:hypothetical protein ACSZMZ_00030 [Aeromonas veronii]
MRRTIIIGIDNRALEKKKDFNINVIERHNISKALEVEIKRDFETNITINEKNIEKFKAQFY